jgi:hypothetical protein
MLFAGRLFAGRMFTAARTPQRSTLGSEAVFTPAFQWAELDVLPVAKMFYKLAGKACFVADNVILGRRMS